MLKRFRPKVQSLTPIGMMLLILLTISCGSEIKYRPLLAGHDYKNELIILGGSHDRVLCREPKFNEYASMHVDDVVALASLLKIAKIPWYARVFYGKKIKALIRDAELIQVRLLKQKTHP